LPAWVLRLWEAFLLQMNDFDILLERKLRQMLDPVVAQRPPVRRGRLNRTDITLVISPKVELAVEPIAVVSPVIAPAPRLLS